MTALQGQLKCGQVPAPGIHVGDLPFPWILHNSPEQTTPSPLISSRRISLGLVPGPQDTSSQDLSTGPVVFLIIWPQWLGTRGESAPKGHLGKGFKDHWCIPKVGKLPLQFYNNFMLLWFHWRPMIFAAWESHGCFTVFISFPLFHPQIFIEHSGRTYKRQIKKTPAYKRLPASWPENRCAHKWTTTS